MADGLYGVKQASKTKAKAISSSTSLAFSSNLASLISSATNNSAQHGRARPSKGKPDIFTVHNKNVKKRAAADMLDEGSQRHQTKDDVGPVDSSELERSRRRMEEKARKYKAMKRGDYADQVGDDSRALVDFDRKWAEAQITGHRNASVSSDDSADDDDNNDEVVEYIDEFGRLRKGTRAAAEREELRKRIQANAQKEAEDSAARPVMPSNVIYGDAIQHEAFNPDQMVADRMAQIAKKRDTSATPPPDAHFDASAEVRTKGTGFYGFSQESGERKAQMDALEKERSETERVRKERQEKKQQRRNELEQRKKQIAQQRGKAQAERFLNDFDFAT